MNTYDPGLASVIEEVLFSNRPVKVSSTTNLPAEILRIIINQEGVEVTHKNSTKMVSLTELINLLSSQENRFEDTTSPVLSLPSSTFAFSGNNNNIQLNCYYPGERKDISFKGTKSTKIYNIPFPNMILYFHLKKIKDLGKEEWKVYSTKYLITPHSVPQLPKDIIINTRDVDKGIFYVPFTNFYVDGGMCYGGNTMPVRHSNNLRGLDYYYKVIFDSPFNSDLGIKNFLYPEGIDRHSVSGFYKWLSEQETFPYERLRVG